MNAMLDRLAIRDACCAVASNSAAEVALVRSLLEREFSQIIGVASDEEWLQFAERDDVAVLVMAFTEAATACGFHHRYVEHRQLAGRRPAQAVILCARADVAIAYELCRAHEIFDYVMFWPVTHDPKRLLLAAHRACDAWQQLARDIHRPSTRLVTSPDSACASAPETAAAPATSRPEPLHEQMVLVVDDDPFQLELVMSVLRSGGVPTTGLTSAFDALALLETGVPGLVLLDVNMPELNGVALLRRLKATPQHTRTPVIMLTAVRDRELVLETLREGAVDYVVKPYSRDTLLRKVRHTLESRP
jgi:CheY-like chemotaxis protein